MAYVIKICLLGTKCSECKHHRPDPERGGDYSCYLNEDLQGQERLDYLRKLVKHYEK